MRIDTELIHGGPDGDPLTGAVTVPIYQTSTFRQPALGRNLGWEYSRTGNPTRAAVEQEIARLEHGAAGFAFGSGMAALTAVLSLFRAGDRILLSHNVYGGTFRVLDQVFARFGIGYAIADGADPAAFAAKLTPDVKAVLLESPANPLLDVTDIRAVAEVAHARGAQVIVDNTFMTPYLQRPLDLGADLVVHSATKYLGGHSDLVAGLAVAKDPAVAARLAFIQNATGGVLGPFDSFLLQRGIKTLGVRMDRHAVNAQRIAEYLAQHPAVAAVHYPGLPADPGYAVNRRQARSGGGMISFELAPGYDYRRFVAATRLIALAESLGGVESLICHPASMTHAAIPAALRQQLGITDGLLRLSVGLEDADDLIEDLDGAFAAARGGDSA